MKETDNVEDVRRGERALVIKPWLNRTPLENNRDAAAILEEAQGLAEAIGLRVIEAVIAKVTAPSPSHLLGKGWVEKLAERVKAEKINLIIFDHHLSPIQQRNLEEALLCKVIDRTGLILEIFGERAKTREGQLQVELAALNYQKSRLVRSWTHLERQRGGFGFLGGPGETQLQIDRRLITNRISKIKGELKDVRRTRDLQRQARKRAEHPTIALVGYTNAGKSTLFNRLTAADVLVKDMLFATLDPTIRGIKLPSGKEAVLSDTVGFIADLPTHLVEAFRATLEEVQLADLILHVRDISHPDTRAQKQDVETVLTELGIEPDDKRIIEVMNKIDRLDDAAREELAVFADKASKDATGAADVPDQQNHAPAGMAAVSAMTGEGIAALLVRMDVALQGRGRVIDASIPLSDGAALAWIYAHGHIIRRNDDDEMAHLQLSLNEADYGRFVQKFVKDSKSEGQSRRS
ncbi:MAG: GTPase HflX [Alphaproteobacteria bacterium]|nr:GTPase HflX [Alphaproteobacteria bacterium]